MHFPDPSKRLQPPENFELPDNDRIAADPHLLNRRQPVKRGDNPEREREIARAVGRLRRLADIDEIDFRRALDAFCRHGVQQPSAIRANPEIAYRVWQRILADNDSYNIVRSKRRVFTAFDVNEINIAKGNQRLDTTSNITTFSQNDHRRPPSNTHQRPLDFDM